MTLATQNSVKVVTVEDNPLISIDPCLVAFGVGRRHALQEMNLPGSVPPDRPIAKFDADGNRLEGEGLRTAYLAAKLPHLQDLQVSRALVKVVYQRGAQRTAAMEEFVSRLAGSIDADGCINPEAIAELLSSCDQVRLKQGRELVTIGEAWKQEVATQMPMAPHLANILRVWDRDREEVRYFLNPNAEFVSLQDLAKTLKVEKVSTPPGSSHYLPIGVAQGCLYPFTEDDRKQTAKLQVMLPHGFHLLDAWFKAENTYLKLQVDKFA